MGERLGRKLALGDHPAPARRRERPGVLGLVVVESVRIGDKDGGTADRGKLGDGRGSGAAKDEMRVGELGREIGEERRSTRPQRPGRQMSASRVEVFRPRLLDDGDPPALLLR